MTLLKKLREEQGASQSDVAERLGISRPTYAALEEGKRGLSLAEAEQLSGMYGVSLEAIATGKLPKEPPLPKETVKKHSEPEERIRVPKEHIEKFKQVLLYILAKTAGKPNVGLTVLFKLLYFSDFDYYEKYGEPLMGLRYLRNHHGPTPRSFDAVVRDMKKNELLEEVQSKYYMFDQRKYLPLKDPDLAQVSGRELEMIDDVIARYGDKTATELSRLSHEDPPWIAADERKDLDYELVFYRPDKLSVREYDPL